MNQHGQTGSPLLLLATDFTPKLWNVLLAPLQSAESVVSFKWQLKTYSSCLDRCLSNLLCTRSAFYVFIVYSRLISLYIVFIMFVAQVVTSFYDFFLYTL